MLTGDGGAFIVGMLDMGESLLLDRLSGTTLALPGMCMGVKMKAMVYILKFSRRGFSRAARSWSGPRMASRGLWSTARSWGWPRTSILHLSSAHAVAQASPSIGWYLLSAGEQNLLATMTVCHPVLQHRGDGGPSHSQYFCVNQHHMASLLQSVAKAVGALSLKFLTPTAHCLAISSFDSSKATSSSADQ